MLQLPIVPPKQQSTDALLVPPSQKERCRSAVTSNSAFSPPHSRLLASTKRDIAVLFNINNGP